MSHLALTPPPQKKTKNKLDLCSRVKGAANGQHSTRERRRGECLCLLQYSDVYLSAAAKLRREIWATHLATLPIKDTLIKYMVLQIIQNIKHTPRQCYSHSVVHRRRERICAMQKPKCQQGTGL